MKDHPECHYSLSSQKECSSINGNYACETIRRVFRNCPGLRPERVYDFTTRDKGTVPKPPGGGDGGDGGIPVFGGRASPQPGGGSPMYIPPDLWKGRDHVFGRLHDRMTDIFRERLFHEPDSEIDHDGDDDGGFGGGIGGGIGGGGGGVAGDRVQSTLPRVPPPHKAQQSQSQSQSQSQQPRADEANKDGSVVARA
eukprot:g9062.t1